MRFDEKLARYLLTTGSETCGANDVKYFAFLSIAKLREFKAYVKAEQALKRWHGLIDSREDYDKHKNELFEAVADLVNACRVLRDPID